MGGLPLGRDETRQSAARDIERAAKAACEAASASLMASPTPVTDLMVISIAIERRNDGAALYVSTHYEGCAACISLYAAQAVIDSTADGFLMMSEEGHCHG